MRILGLGLLAMALAACGFQLRGQYTLPALLNPISISSKQVTLERNLVAGVTRMGGTISASAPYQLRIISERINRQTSTINPLDKAAEYTLIYSLYFQLKYASGIPALPERNILLRRTYQFDNTRIVGKADEEQTLVDEMRQQASNLILAQLARVKLSDLTPESAKLLETNKASQKHMSMPGARSTEPDQEDSGPSTPEFLP